ncbi:hypothetical protein MBLNU459_g2634t1 [Dothideomycetes sp. NU459]
MSTIKESVKICADSPTVDPIAYTPIAHTTEATPFALHRPLPLLHSAFCILHSARRQPSQCHEPYVVAPSLLEHRADQHQQISKHYTRILSRWPVDQLRPELTFQNLLKKRIAAAPGPHGAEHNTAQAVIPSPRDPAAELREVNALYLLLDNRYTNEYPVSKSLMRPASNPDHYTNLAKELDEIPSRSRFGNFLRRLQNMVRMK